jgi:hypothetical protein
MAATIIISRTTQGRRWPNACFFNQQLFPSGTHVGRTGRNADVRSSRKSRSKRMFVVFMGSLGMRGDGGQLKEWHYSCGLKRERSPATVPAVTDGAPAEVLAGSRAEYFRFIGSVGVPPASGPARTRAYRTARRSCGQRSAI